MAGYKETPRQKMIGMMYLVLTALLALNVSKDILDSFVVVNESLVVTNENYEKKINLSYDNFKKQNDLNPGKVKTWYDKSLLAKKYAKDLIDTIRSLEAQILVKVEGVTKEEAYKLPLRKVTQKANKDIATNFFYGQAIDGSDGKARMLKNEINKFKKLVMALVPADAHNLIIQKRLMDNGKEVLDTLGLFTGDTFNEKEGGMVTWERKNFSHIVLAGIITNMNKMIIEVRNAEFDVVNTLYQRISAEDFKFDKIAAKVVPRSSYVLVGSEYEADIFVAAYDSKQTPEVYVGADVDTVTSAVIGTSEKVEGSEGVVKYKVTASGIGEKKYGGIIKIKKSTGEEKSYWFKSEYVVGQPSATVSADKMNVFYIGVDNPVTISVPGVPNDKVRPSITAGTLTSSGGGKYIVKVATGYAETTINVAADIGGKTTSMGTSKFRVKRIPDPVAYIGGVKSGLINKNVIAASKMIVAKLDNFDFDLTFIVTSYTFLINVKGDIIPTTCSGNMLTTDVSNKISKAPTGSRVYFEDIKAKGPDGSTRSLSPVNLKLQ
jgi:gliding motility-associated protein GldM